MRIAIGDEGGEVDFELVRQFWLCELQIFVNG